jgi:hypothetical protein
MKKVLLFIGLFIAANGYSQTIDTTIKSCTAAKINSKVYSHDIPVISDTLTHLGVFNYTDDLKGNCVANWVLIATNKNILWSEYKLTDSEYTGWNGTATTLLAIIAARLGLTFK